VNIRAPHRTFRFYCGDLPYNCRDQEAITRSSGKQLLVIHAHPERRWAQQHAHEVHDIALVVKLGVASLLGCSWLAPHVIERLVERRRYLGPVALADPLTRTARSGTVRRLAAQGLQLGSSPMQTEQFGPRSTVPSNHFFLGSRHVVSEAAQAYSCCRVANSRRVYPREAKGEENRPAAA
jgi:hypothetical protein